MVHSNSNKCHYNFIMDNGHEARNINASLKIFLDFLMLVIVGLPIVIFKFAGSPFKRGFFCDDESIKHPLKEDTISDAVLISISLIVVILGILIGEFVIYKQSHMRRKYQSNNDYVFAKWRIHPYLCGVYKSVGIFLFTAAASQSATDIMKYCIGRLRPNFLTVCAPDWSAFNCTDDQGRYRYVTEDVCTGDPHIIRESRLSHPSGHASFSLCCFLFLTFYLQAHLKWKGSKLLRPFLQVVLIYMSLYTGISRISDYKHHWSDVLGGFVLGFIVSTVCVFSLAEFYKIPTMRDVAKQVMNLQRATIRQSELTNVVSDHHSASNRTDEGMLNSGGNTTFGTPGSYEKKQAVE